MNIDTGEILAMGSNPTFDPTDLIEPSQAQVNELYRDPVLAPLVNRATEGAYPTGSIFKIITALAALENGQITPGHGGPGQRPDRSRHRAPSKTPAA